MNETLRKYTLGEATLEETNAALKEAGAGYHLDPAENTITEEDLRRTTVGHYPEQANGVGLLDTGTGTLDKVEVKDGKLVDCDCGEMYALCIIAGKTYQVKGDKLVDYVARESGGQRLPDGPDMGRRMDLAGQIATQRTKRGTYDVTYDADGYAVRAGRR